MLAVMEFGALSTSTTSNETLIICYFEILFRSLILVEGVG
jgi:hypothetical protein